MEGNGRITYKNTTYDWGSAVNLLFELGEVGITEYFRIGEDSRIDLLYKADSNGTAMTNFPDDDYIWNSDEQKFLRQ